MLKWSTKALNLLVLLMKKLAGKMTLGPDGIWGDVNDYNEQENEKKLRQSVADQIYSDHLLEISAHHSIPVMDQEIEKFLVE